MTDVNVNVHVYITPVYLVAHTREDRLTDR
jgi:hypothetical protein